MDSNNMNEMNNMNSNAYNGGSQPPAGEQKGMSIASMILGICGFLAWCIPLFGFPVTIIGLVLGFKGMHKGGKGMAIAGIIMCIITLVLTVINAAAGAYLGATGQLGF